MIRPRIYIDTSVFGMAVSKPLDDRGRFMQEYARRFLELSDKYEGFISEVVAQEAGQAPVVIREAMRVWMEGLPILEVTPVVLDVARVYRAKMVMPSNNESDSVHVALTVVNHMDSLVTWNLKHMANPNKQEVLRLVNTGMGLSTPVICSPMEWVSGLEGEYQ